MIIVCIHEYFSFISIYCRIIYHIHQYLLQPVRITNQLLRQKKCFLDVVDLCEKLVIFNFVLLFCQLGFQPFFLNHFCEVHTITVLFNKIQIIFELCLAKTSFVLTDFTHFFKGLFQVEFYCLLYEFLVV